MATGYVAWFQNDTAICRFGSAIFLPLSFCLPASVCLEAGDKKRAAERWGRGCACGLSDV